jgi:hypothetical protein
LRIFGVMYLARNIQGNSTAKCTGKQY